MFGVEDVFAQGVTVPVAGTTTVATNPFIVSSNPANHAQAVDLIRIQYNTWVSSYGAGPILSPAGAPLRIRSKPFVSGVDPAATGSALCRVRNNPPLGSSDCYVSNVVSMTLHSLTAWHETGHGFNALISLRKSSKVRPYDATMGCVGSSHNNNEGMSLEEGLADWYETATRWSTGNIPQGNNGVHCNNFQYAPLSFTSAPPAPACGTGAIPNSEFHVEKGLLELIDANTIPNEAGCRNEQVQISPGVILDALSRFTTTTSSASCPGNSPGLEEGGLSEGSFCSPSTPNWPYTGTNALQVVDQTSFLDLLAILKNQFGVSGSGLFDVWANTGFERGDSATQLP
jgi:hypothetical protein